MLSKKDRVLKEYYSNVNGSMVSISKKFGFSYSYIVGVIRREKYLHEFKRNFLINRGFRLRGRM